METGQKPNIVTHTFRVGGMTCVNCQNRIERKLKSAAGVVDAAVDFAAGTTAVTHDAAIITPNELQAAIETLGYTILDKKEQPPAIRIAGTLIIIFALYALLRQLGIGTL
ncbi:MAG: heavy-metal-associated domain-containing protein, partial [Treponema sp.]|nr:heavy-metal-associated domain-containing protein [Treponema sp.]